MPGSRLPCPACGSPARDEERFCTACGTQLPLPQGQATAAILEADSGEVPWSIGNIAAGLLIFLVLLVAVALGVRSVGGIYPAHEMALETWVAVHLLGACSVLVAWYMGLRKLAPLKTALGLVRPATSARTTLVLSIGALGFSIVATFAYGLVVEEVGLEVLKPPEIQPELFFPGLAFLLTLQALVMVTPLSEEILFRGFVLRGLLPRIGAGPAIVSTALVFSAFHFNAGTIIPIFLTGLALGYLYVRTGSLWPCVAAHAGQNAIALLTVRFGL